MFFIYFISFIKHGGVEEEFGPCCSGVYSWYPKDKR